MSDVTPLSDEVLMAYADGELSAATRRIVERRLAEDADARARLAAFEGSAEMARRALDAIAREPVPASIVAAIRHDAVGPQPARPWHRAWRRLRAWMERPAPLFGPVPAWAPALALTLGLGVGIGYLAGPDTAVSPGVAVGPVAPRQDIHAALETTPSGRQVAVTGGTFQAIVSFRDHDGRVCREFEVAGVSSPTALQVGLACRAPSAGWTVEFLTAGTARPSVDGMMHAPASARVHDAVDAYIDSRLAGSPLTADQEATLIENGWRGPDR